MIMFGIPPNFINLALASPIVLDTDNLPGFTRNGPNKIFLYDIL